ncbi:MAG: NapH/MauN family ferredoxin-type protein [bacterium]|nr:NapH/MauN family ferredoxin-type protein [bacterium]
MNQLMDSLLVLFGKAPHKASADEFTEAANAHHAMRNEKRPAGEREHIKAHRKQKAEEFDKWKMKRWISIVLVNLIFILSYRIDLQLVEGALTGSRFVGFHMADLNAAMQVMLAYKEVLINLLIGIVTIFIGWWLLGGRAFCSWVCPYHLFAEWAEMLHLWLAKKGLAKHHSFDRRGRLWIWLIFAVLAYVTGYTVYETISPTGILSRALIYGPGLALIWVGALLLFEVFYSRRFWCRYACPIGLTYGLVGSISPLKIVHNTSKCFHDGACRSVCMVPHVLDPTRKGRATEMKTALGADCTRCGMCIDVCPTEALTFQFKVIGKPK